MAQNPQHKIAAVKGTYAYTAVALHNIEAGECITFSYSAGGYLGYSEDNGETCLCASCNPDKPPVVKKRERSPEQMVDEPNFNQPKKKKKKVKSRGQKRCGQKMKDSVDPSLSSQQGEHGM